MSDFIFDTFRVNPEMIRYLYDTGQIAYKEVKPLLDWLIEIGKIKNYNLKEYLDAIDETPNIFDSEE